MPKEELLIRMRFGLLSWNNSYLYGRYDELVFLQETIMAWPKPCIKNTSCAVGLNVGFLSVQYYGLLCLKESKVGCIVYMILFICLHMFKAHSWALRDSILSRFLGWVLTF